MQFRPNAWGFYDMLGNLWSWVDDWYDPDYYTKAPAKTPVDQEKAVENLREEDAILETMNMWQWEIDSSTAPLSNGFYGPKTL